jgi:hypothetical protein
MTSRILKIIFCSLRIRVQAPDPQHWILGVIDIAVEFCRVLDSSREGWWGVMETEFCSMDLLSNRGGKGEGALLSDIAIYKGGGGEECC